MNTLSRPLGTIILTLLCLLITFGVNLFDTSLFSFNGNPLLSFSFMPEFPFRNQGITLYLSAFVHMGVEHLLINMVFFIPLAMMIERKYSGKHIILIFFSLHLMTLSLLSILHFVMDLRGTAFLGMSHIVVGLSAFWGLLNKRYLILGISFLFLIVGYWQEQSTLVQMSHLCGLLSGVLLMARRSLWANVNL